VFLVVDGDPGLADLLHLSQQRPDACDRSRRESGETAPVGLAQRRLRLMRQERLSQPGTVRRGAVSDPRRHQTDGMEAGELLEVDHLRAVERRQVHCFAGMVPQDGQRRLRNLAQVTVTKESLSEGQRRQTQPVASGKRTLLGETGGAQGRQQAEDRALVQAHPGADLGEPDLCFAQGKELENRQGSFNGTGDVAIPRGMFHRSQSTFGTRNIERRPAHVNPEPSIGLWRPRRVRRLPVLHPAGSKTGAS
jgi:hypothetical protein